MNNGYFSIPRSIIDSEKWQNLSLKYQSLFITILRHVRFEETEHDDHGVLIKIMPGQVCLTIRRLHEICHKDLSKTDIERGLSKLKLIGFCRQEVRHVKTIITITEPELYNLITKQSETRSETRVRQERDKNETQIKNVDNEDNEKNKKIKKEKILKIAFREFVFLTQTEYDELLQKDGQELLNLMLDILNSYKGSSGRTYKSDYFVMKEGGWVREKALERIKSGKIIPLSNNYEKAKEIEKTYVSATWRMDVTEQHVVFEPLQYRNGNREILKYENGFLDQFDGHLRKKGFEKLKMEIKK